MILVGQPELNAVLNSHPFRQLKQRVSLRYHLQPLNKEDTLKYVENRLTRAGAIDPHIFTPKAMEKIYTYSQGIPRLINIISDHALLAGYSENKTLSDLKSIKEAVQKLESLPRRKEKKKNRGLIWIHSTDCYNRHRCNYLSGSAPNQWNTISILKGKC